MGSAMRLELWLRPLLLGVVLSVGSAVVSVKPLTAASNCPKEFEPFVTEMLAELPAYANRVNTRVNNRQTYVILAGRADFEDLPLLQASFPPPDQAENPVRQVFFSTLLKRFSQNKIIQQQEHHWLLMAPSDRGWEFVQLYSILESYPSQKLAAPPRNSSEGSIATAIKDWLKACHYNAAS